MTLLYAGLATAAARATTTLIDAPPDPPPIMLNRPASRALRPSGFAGVTVLALATCGIVSAQDADDPPPTLTPSTAPPPALIEDVPGAGESSDRPVATETVTTDAPELPDLETSSSSGVTFEFTPGVWIPRPVGNVVVSPGTRLDLQDDLDLGGLEASPRFELAVHFTQGWAEEWFVRGDVFDFSHDTSDTFELSGAFGGLLFSPGDPFKADLDMTGASVEIGRTIYQPVPEKHRSVTTAPEAALRFALFGGVQYLDVDQSLELVGVGKVNTGGEWFAIHGGIEFTLDFEPADGLWVSRAFKLQAGVAGGADLDNGDSYWRVHANGVFAVTDHIAFLFGYRLIDVAWEDGDYNLDGGLQGLFFAGRITF